MGNGVDEGLFLDATPTSLSKFTCGDAISFFLLKKGYVVCMCLICVKEEPTPVLNVGMNMKEVFH